MIRHIIWKHESIFSTFSSWQFLSRSLKGMKRIHSKRPSTSRALKCFKFDQNRRWLELKQFQWWCLRNMPLFHRKLVLLLISRVFWASDSNRGQKGLGANESYFFAFIPTRVSMCLKMPNNALPRFDKSFMYSAPVHWGDERRKGGVKFLHLVTLSCSVKFISAFAKPVVSEPVTQVRCLVEIGTTRV